MKNPSADEVAAAIRSVLSDLFGTARVPARLASHAEVFAGRLFALRHAEALTPSAREVRLSPGTVVTPLARDFLKQRGIAVRMVSDAEVKSHRPEGEWGFAIDDPSGTSAALRRALLEDRAGWFEIAAREVAPWVASAAARAAILVTPEASLAVWDAHQFATVRAATAADAEAVCRAIRYLGPNLLVIEPFGQSIHSLRHICTAFRRAGAPTPPPGLTVRRGPASGLDGYADRRGDRSSDALPRASEPAQSPPRRRPADDPPSLVHWLARAR